MPVTRSERAWTVDTVRPVRYSVSVVDHYFKTGDPALVLGHTSRSRKRAVVIDREVNRMYGDQIFTFLEDNHIRYHHYLADITEANKNLDATIRLWDWLNEIGINRRSEPVIAIGGGALTDIVGFALACDARGKPWVRVVTTGQITDAGTSAKTGCNHNGRKSALGSFHPPTDTIVDRSFLASVSPENIRDNMAEAVKYGLMHDAALFRLIDDWGIQLIDERLQGYTPEGDGAAREYIERCLDVTLNANADNIDESNLWRSMYFGHTWSGAWEMASLQLGRLLSHGRAVALDMALSTVIAWQTGLLTYGDRDHILFVLRKVGLPTYDPLMDDTQLLRGATTSALSSRDGHLLLPLSNGIGAHDFREDVDFDVIAAAADWLATHE